MSTNTNRAQSGVERVREDNVAESESEPITVEDLPIKKERRKGAGAPPKPENQQVGSAGVTTSKKQAGSSILNLREAKQSPGRMLKRELEDLVTTLDRDLAAAKEEILRQKEKKRREKSRANTLAELAKKQSEEPRAPEPKDDKPIPNTPQQQVSFETAEKPKMNPRDNPKVKRFLQQGADLKTAIKMAGV